RAHATDLEGTAGEERRTAAVVEHDQGFDAIDASDRRPSRTVPARDASRRLVVHVFEVPAHVERLVSAFLEDCERRDAPVQALAERRPLRAAPARDEVFTGRPRDELRSAKALKNGESGGSLQTGVEERGPARAVPFREALGRAAVHEREAPGHEERGAT